MDWKSDLSLSILIVVSIIQLSHADDFNTTLVLYHSMDNWTEVPLENAVQLFPYLNKDLITILYAFGFLGSRDGDATVTMMSTYCSFGNFNVVLINWIKGASNPYSTPAAGYSLSAAPNAVTIGNALGYAIVKLVKLGLEASKIHLIGLSLGAHLVGYAGRKANAEGYPVYRATGLDPAGILFDPSVGYIPINQDSADFVDNLHTDIGHCGMKSGSGHVDFFFNAGNYENVFASNVQPGCDAGYELCGNLCSHNRSVYYWVEALKFLKNFLAGLARTYQEYVRANGVFNVTTYVGLLCNTSYRGHFYLSTNRASLYGRQEAGLKPNPNP